MSDVRPELQQIREALSFGADYDFPPRVERLEFLAALAALARVEATLNEQQAEIKGGREAWMKAQLRFEAAEARVVAAEAERDALVAALEEIARMTEPHWRIGSARHTAREALALARPAPAEPPREEDA